MSETNYIERYWRDAKPEDAIKEPPMVARFRIDKNDKWSVCTLQGIDRSIDFPWRGQNYAGRECQVYDAPDPGEGWRLIDTATEKPQYGDEYYNRHGEWVLRAMPSLRWTGQDIYRRRITPAVTYVPFTWEDREQLRGRWIYRNGFPENEFLLATISKGSNGNFYARGISSERLCTDYTFVDTGKPVGKEVTQ